MTWVLSAGSDINAHSLTRPLDGCGSPARHANLLEVRDQTRLGVLAAGLALASACSSGHVGAPRGSPVPGTSAWVDDHTVSPIHVGQYIGQLKKVGSGCQGSSGTSSSGGWDVSMYVDKNCRVFVSSIRNTGGHGGQPPSGGTVVTPTLVTPNPG